MMKTKPRYLFILLVACLVSVVPVEEAARSESKSVVESIDSAGIEKLIKNSQGTVIVAMAAWCLPCRKELPTLVKLYKKYESRGLKMIGISLDLNGPEAIQPVLEKARATFPVYWAGEEAVEGLNIRALPLLLLVKDGSIVEKIVGTQPEAILDQRINDLLK